MAYKEKGFTTIQIAKILGMSSFAFRQWVLWWESLSKEQKKACPLKLPEPKINPVGWRIYTNEDIQKFFEFKTSKHKRGLLRQWHAKRTWGKRGKKYLKKYKQQEEVKNGKES